MRQKIGLRVNQKVHMYRISANSCRDNYSFLEALDATTIQGRQLFKGGNYSRKYGMYNVGII